MNHIGSVSVSPRKERAQNLPFRDPKSGCIILSKPKSLVARRRNNGCGLISNGGVQIDSGGYKKRHISMVCRKVTGDTR
jgi:hypothetical protein